MVGEREKPILAGMTVNERMSHVDIIDLWDDAVRHRDRSAMVALLEQVEVSEPHLIADAVLADPKKFGF
jgi:hypothetical protein